MTVDRSHASSRLKQTASRITSPVIRARSKILAREIGDSGQQRRKQQIGQRVGDDPVRLFGPGANEPAQTRFEMQARDLLLARRGHSRKRRIGIASATIASCLPCMMTASMPGSSNKTWDIRCSWC
jgi:hypothetical protein